MKKFIFLTVFATTLSLFCEAQVKKSYNDDIYYSPKDAKPAPEAAPATTNEGVSQEKAQPSTTTETAPAAVQNNNSGSNAVTNENFSYDDYYDYAYASRLKRFHTSSNLGYNYYDSFYTNSYWYNSSPSNFGVSIYMGSGWAPYRPAYYWNDPFYPWYNPYWAYNPYFYNPYYHPYYYNPYYSHYHQHHHYWNDGNWNNNHYSNTKYGPRGGATFSSSNANPGTRREVNEQRFGRPGEGRDNSTRPTDGNNVTPSNNNTNNTVTPAERPRFSRPDGNNNTPATNDPNKNKLPDNPVAPVDPATQPKERPRFQRPVNSEPRQEQQQQPRQERPRENNRNSGYETPRNDNSGGGSGGGSRSNGGDRGTISRPR